MFTQLQYRLENRTYPTINRFRHGLTAGLTIKERPDLLINLRQPNDVITSLYPEPATTEPEGKAGLLEAFGHCDRLAAKADRVV